MTSLEKYNISKVKGPRGLTGTTFLTVGKNQQSHKMEDNSCRENYLL